MPLRRGVITGGQRPALSSHRAGRRIPAGLDPGVDRQRQRRLRGLHMQPENLQRAPQFVRCGRDQQLQVLRG